MTPHAQRVAIAQACGWTQIYNVNTMAAGGLWYGYPPINPIIGKPVEIPQYLQDLNAMNRAEETLTEDQQEDFVCALEAILYPAGFPHSMYEPHWFIVIHATAAERAQAFLWTLEMWKHAE